MIGPALGVPALVVLGATALAANAVVPDRIAQAFGDTPGTFVLMGGVDGLSLRFNPARAATRFPPCSTFKIANAAIALATGVATGPDFHLAYDPGRDPAQPTWPADWAQDQTLASALKRSVVWYFQELARRIGHERMALWVTRLGYGNQDVSGPIDGFWLGRSLRISADEQVLFLRRMFGETRVAGSDEPPGFHSAMAMVRGLLALERTPRYQWYGKTGTCQGDQPTPVAWHVGFVERDGHVTVYALNLSDPDLGQAFRRRNALIRRLLADQGLIDLEPPRP